MFGIARQQNFDLRGVAPLLGLQILGNDLVDLFPMRFKVIVLRHWPGPTDFRRS
jgi:hypothetical protein